MQQLHAIRAANRMRLGLIAPMYTRVASYSCLMCPTRLPYGRLGFLIACRGSFCVFCALNPVLTYVNAYSCTDKSHNDCKHITQVNTHIYTRSPIPGTRDSYVPYALTILQIVTVCTLG